MPATIGFVGLGAMGAEMAETLVSKQWRVVGYDIRREAIDRLVNERAAARSAKDFAKADEVRKQLQEMGIMVQDTAQGSEWEVHK